MRLIATYLLWIETIRNKSQVFTDAGHIGTFAKSYY